MDKLKLTGQNLGQSFNFRYVHARVPCTSCTTPKLPNLKLKFQPKQLEGSIYPS